MILSAIIDKEDITVSDEDVENRIQESMDAAGELTPELEERMREYWNSQRESLEASIMRKKALQLIVDNATITEVESISVTPASEEPAAEAVEQE